jgi:hypothetical protein
MSVAALVLGIVGIFLSILFVPSVLAMIFGFVGNGQIQRSGGAQKGRGMAIAGIVLGAVGIVFAVVVLAFGSYSFHFGTNSRY